MEYELEKLPSIDAVLISHDHYDHLDYASIRYLKDQVKKFFVPLGVKAHLLRWGVKREQIVSMDWYDTFEFETLKFILAPSRYFSGDTGYFEAFKDVGEAHGPFDLAFMECGAYDKNWSQVHMFPEQAVQAAIDLKARHLFPIYNSKFNLSLHPWRDPLDKVLSESQRNNMPLVTSQIGRKFELNSDLPRDIW